MSERERERRLRFDGLCASHGPDIVSYCSWRAGSRSDAQDAVAEVFLTAWRELAVAWGASASAWTYTVTYSSLGATPNPVAPANARPLRRTLPVR